MSSDLPPTAQREALNADITATRAELGRTLEAIAAKTQVKTRAKQAARETVDDVRQAARETAIGVGHRVSVTTSKARAEATGWWQRLRALPARQRLSVAAVLGAGVLSAAFAVVRSRSKGGCR